MVWSPLLIALETLLTYVVDCFLASFMSKHCLSLGCSAETFSAMFNSNHIPKPNLAFSHLRGLHVGAGAWE